MRRKDRQLSAEEAEGVLARGEYGVLATIGPDGQPYAVPLSYVARGGALYFHCAPEGHKINNLRFESRACFTVVGPTEPVYDGGFSTYFESAVVFGPVREVTDAEEKRAALHELALKYLPGHMDKAEPDIARSFSRTAVYALKIEVLTGKAKKRKL